MTGRATGPAHAAPAATARRVVAVVAAARVAAAGPAAGGGGGGARPGGGPPAQPRGGGPTPPPTPPPTSTPPIDPEKLDEPLAGEDFEHAPDEGEEGGIARQPKSDRTPKPRRSNRRHGRRR